MNMEEHMPWIKQQARRIATQLPDHIILDDLVQDGCIGMLKAMTSFEQGHASGASLRTYASRFVSGAILDGAAKWQGIPRSIRRSERNDAETVRSAEQATGRSRQHALPEPVVCEVIDPEPLPDEVALSHQALIALARLPERERDVLLHLYYGDLLLHEVGTRMGIRASSQVCETRKRALNRLRAELTGD